MCQYSDWVFPPVTELPDVIGLPDPFQTPDGGRVTDRNEWEKQRAYFKAMLSHYLYGSMPPAPASVTGIRTEQKPAMDGKAVEERHLIICHGDKKELQFRLRLLYPADAQGFPVIILNTPDESEGCPIEEELVAGRGYALAAFNRVDIAPDSEQFAVHIAEAYPGYTWRAIAAWAWGHMRTLDYLLTLGIPADFSKVCVTGHSRGGKAALCAGVYDERFAVVVPNGSGCGGAGCLRVLGGRNGKSQDPRESESVGRIASVFPYWWSPEFGAFGGAEPPYELTHEARLPFDSHILRAMVAPRVCLSTDAFGDEWANPFGTQLAWEAAQPVFDFLGAGENNLTHVREGGHDQNEEDWQALLDCCGNAFYGKNPTVAFNRPRFPKA